MWPEDEESELSEGDDKERLGKGNTEGYVQ